MEKVSKSSSAKFAPKTPRKSATKKSVFSLLNRAWLTFFAGAILGAIFFGLFYGWNLVDFNNVAWIFTPAAHDTGQHQLGWTFFAQNSVGGRIENLAYPTGVPITFLDSIPLFAFAARAFGFGAGQQYFGLFGLASYLLFGGFAALILRAIFAKIRARFAANFARENPSTLAQFQLIFVWLGMAFLVVSPLMIARTFYHTGLAAQWLIFAGFLLILYREKLFSSHIPVVAKTAKSQTLLARAAIRIANFGARFSASATAKFVAIWATIMILVVLIHPYFLPEIFAILVVNAALIFPKNPREIRRDLGALFVRIFAPILVALAIFALIGGFSLGGQTGATDLNDKGFNLLAFFWPAGYSAIFPFAGSIAKSGSPETNAWLGAGVLAMLVFALVFWLANRRKKSPDFGAKNSSRASIFSTVFQKIRAFGRVRFWLIFAAIFGLVLLAFSPSIQAGHVVLLRLPVSGILLKVWQDFRAAAREIWPIYYAITFAAIYVFSREFLRFLFARAGKKSRIFGHVLDVFALTFFLVVALQIGDILLSSEAKTHAQNFARIAHHDVAIGYEFPLNLSGIVAKQKHLVNLNLAADGDMSEFNVLGQTAARYKMTLNVGYFARIPDAAIAAQKAWRTRAISGKLTAADLRENLFVTKDRATADELAAHYEVARNDAWWFVVGEK